MVIGQSERGSSRVLGRHLATQPGGPPDAAGLAAQGPVTSTLGRIHLTTSLVPCTRIVIRTWRARGQPTAGFAHFRLPLGSA